MVKHINTKLNKNNPSVDELVELLRMLSDETRQQILGLVSTQKEVNVSDIAKNFRLSRPTISHHLNIMKRTKLLSSHKEGKEVFYSFNKSYVINILEAYVNHLKKCC